MEADTGTGDQITVDQIIQDAFSRKKQIKPLTKVDILDLDELREFQGRKRKEFESYLKRNRLDLRQWIRYAIFEIEQHDMRRARSVFERALLVDSTFIPLWIRYIDSEIKAKCINHARNLLDRAVTTLPRVDKLWYKYLILEESLGNNDIVRSLFAKWCSLEPGSGAWDSFIEFEIRQEMWENVRDVYSRYVRAHPFAKVWSKWIQFEKTNGNTDTVRKVYSLALDTLVSYESVLGKTADTYTDDLITLILSYADWEAANQEYERCSVLFKISLEKWPNNALLMDGSMNFEKKFGKASTINEAIVHGRKRKYEESLMTEPRNFELWMLYIDLIEKYFPDQMVDVFERAITTARPTDQKVKSFEWRKYIYVCIRYLTYMELELNEVNKCREFYQRLVNEIIPHKYFTFSKIWIMYGKFEVRHGDISSVRRILGRAIGMCPKNKIFKGYIELEIKLKEFDRVRTLFEKYLVFNPSNSKVWIDYAELEENLDDEERARMIYDLSLRDYSVSLSKESKVQIIERFINFETDAGGYDNARKLYRQFLDLTGYSAKVWISYAMYEYSTPTNAQSAKMQEATADLEDLDEIEFEPTIENLRAARKIYEEALVYYKRLDDKKNRMLIFEAYQQFENNFGSTEDQEGVKARMPTRISKIIQEQGVEREYIDYIFPDDTKPSISSTSKLLQLAKKWKKDQEN
ncbi:hypothetical protein KAFR_0B03040 [Kazachstania africana CBS 2517]|uniref:Pre-mRNA-splicing factor CLF1 n=1 Tax=Kazachstania africana (strain ATCC 22294 / BCRC 22015 / CBS 2517 / CECT 1963 / NBRC 1671 / NRRL Y-8276) TaxID=1071382 RepID=H2AQF0_KAZAF|nr:hypothetical protein KAFR_0B03040 [Kazachstania africana CBS 2517]CCF56600.1 hypothetical protein KAFR_0B03040 [Kazachstania africana CBS 2517]